ncbi:MAG: hypothetical protein E3J72_15875 [Planctomycetota bacterium]|nr:MAG: hypothetical protein E3J72_15875 [Planctomycetota bacterium]
MKRSAIFVIIIIVFGLAFAMPGCGGGSKSSRGGGGGGGTGTGSGTGSGTGNGTGTGGNGTGGNPDLPFGESSGGSGGGSASGATLITPSSSSGPIPLMIVYSGTEGASMMAQNIQQLRGMVGLSGVLFAVLDGKSASASQGASVIDALRAGYDIDNDKMYLLSESAGTRSGLELGFGLRQSYFAAYWANDVNASATPAKTAADLGFAPHGNAGPGGAYAAANAIVEGMRNAGYRLPSDAPYSGPGSSVHGGTDQFVAAMQWFAGKSRQ